MEENILIKSEVDEKVKKIFLSLFMGFFCLSCLTFLILFVARFEANYGYVFMNNYINGFEVIFGEDGWAADEWVYTMCIVLFALHCIAFLAGLTMFIIFCAISQCELEVTEKNVIGKTFFGKQVVLPMYMISAYSTTIFLSRIAVATSSGITKFFFIKNYKEIGVVLSKKINERQESTESHASTPAPALQANAIDELKKT